MDALIANVNKTAMVLGYPVMAVVIILIAWFGTRIFRDLNKIFNEMRYDRWRRRNAERDWDNIESSWVLEPYDDDRGPINYFNGDTLVLPDLSEQLHNYREEYP